MHHQRKTRGAVCVAFLSAFALGACGPKAQPPDAADAGAEASTPDAGRTEDVSAMDAVDDHVSAADAATPDAPSPDVGSDASSAAAWDMAEWDRSTWQ